MEKHKKKTAEMIPLVNAGFPPTQTGQKFKRYKDEVEKWARNNKASEDDKYIDLLDSMKKNDMIKYFEQKTLIEKVADTRTVTKILEVLSEQYSITKGERLLYLMKGITNFSTEGNVEKLMDNFEEMITETDKAKLTENLKYALSLQFVEHLEKSKQIDLSEKLRLKDAIQDVDGNPREGNITEYLRKEMKKLKVENN